MGLCGWIVFGFIAGLVGRAVTPGPQRMGLIATTLLGIGGAFVGGYLTQLIRGDTLFILHPAGFLGSVVGSIVLLLVGSALSKQGRAR
jgi:uncharacterized membrane protein YeaQ/YmgE (transglycosylase-associated protein family)